MERTDSTSRIVRPSALEQPPGDAVALFLRLWKYGGPSQQLTGLGMNEDPEVAGLIQTLVNEAHGRIVGQQPEILAAHFNDPLHAVAAAKSLQQRFLTFHRKFEPQQVVPSVLISSVKPGESNGSDFLQPDLVSAAALLANNSARILVSERIHQFVKNTPGFQFSSQPWREADEKGETEAIFELLWTDESTYGHLRQAGRDAGFNKVGRYEIQAELGRGAMGVVYKAYDQLIGRIVALKTISIQQNTPDRDELIERLKQEAKAAGGLDHPNIITIYDVGQENDLVYLSMQFLEGKTLLALLAEGNLPPLSTVLSWADQVCSAVGFAHVRGVIHRDLKPANLMLTSQGVVKILDFGIAKIENATLTQTGLVVGTPSHMAPEQVMGKKIDHRADIFALGSVFYELVTGDKPFRGDVTTILYKIVHEDPVAPSLVNPALPGGIDAIIRKALAKDPRDRFQTCEEMREAFREQAVGMKSIAAVSRPAPPKLTAPPAPRPGLSDASYLLEEIRPARRRVWPSLVATAFFAVAGLGGWSFYTKSHTGQYPQAVQKAEELVHRGFLQRLKHESAPSSQQSAHNQGDQAINNSNPVGGGQASVAHSAADNASSSSVTQPPAQQSPAENSGTSVSANLQGSTISPSSMSPGENSQTPGANTSSPASSSASPQPQPASPGQNATNSPAQTQTPAGTAVAGTPMQPGKSQPGDQNVQTSKASNSASASDNPPPSTGDPSATSSEAPTTRPVKKSPPPAPLKVDGFARRDVPELVRQADAAAGRGDYRLARYEYNLILKLDRSNAAARAGLRRIQDARQDQLR